MNNKSFVLVIILSIIHIFSFGQVELDMISPKKMKKDLEVLLESLDGHPDPYSKISEVEFQKIVKDVEKAISTELDEVDFYKNLSRIVASIGDGHTGIFMPRFWLNNMRKKHGVFPYDVFLTNEGGLYVIEAYGDTKIPKGARILEINGMSIDAFVEAVTPHISFETIPFRNDGISRSFEFMLYLVFKQIDQLTFKYKVYKESEAIVRVMDYKEWKGQKKGMREDKDKMIALGKTYNFEIIEPGVAKIDIFAFAVPSIDKYKAFLNKTFKAIRKNNVHSLIIDVRGNYGGWPKVASELFHFIHDGHFKTMAKSSTKISKPYRMYFFDRNPSMRTTNYIFPKNRHFVDVEKVVNGRLDTYVDEESFFNEAPITEPFEFKGDTYLLIDRKSYSAASSFASTFQCYNMGYLIGEPTGGTKIFRANAFGKKLPRTFFYLSTSTTKLYTACYSEENQPVLPNVEVVPSIIQRVHKIDAQLKMALMLIKKVQNSKAKVD